jgi:lipopolysaccharide heptosyltransferase II
MKILILKPSSLGDVVQAIPVLRMIKRHWAASEIYWWIADDLQGLLEADPDLNGVFLFRRRRWRHPGHWHEAVASVMEMRRHRFDLVIDLQALARSALAAWFAGAGRNVGLDDMREGASALYDQSVPRPSFDTHAVDWYLGVVRSLNVPVRWDFEWLPPRPGIQAQLPPNPAAEAVAWVAVIPGARWANKRWPIEHYALALNRVAQSHPAARFVILGGPGDAEMARQLAAAVPERTCNTVGGTTLPQMVEWVRRCSLVLTNDTGPMHVAAALGRPVVALFGPTHPARTGPYRQLDAVLRVPMACAPCMRPRCRNPEPVACLRQLPPAQVAEVVRRRLLSPLAQMALV